MADAFISYSRKDSAFAAALKSRLETGGFEVLFDVEDILGSEDWARRLVDLIAAADHFVFVISPDSCGSRVCALETNTAVDLSKSIVPVALHDTPADAIPSAIAARHWIDCRADRDPARGAAALTQLFRTSPEWIRQHTELTGRARDWHLARRRSALLRGRDLKRAEQWLANAEDKEPPASSLQTTYIAESRRWRRTRRSIAAALLVLAAASAGAGWRMIEHERRLSADTERVSIASDWIARDPTRAALVLLEVADPERTPYATSALTQLLTQPIARCELSGHAGGVRDVAISPRGELFMTIAGDSVVRIWRADGCPTAPVQELVLPNDAIDQAFFTDRGGIVFLSRPSGAQLWSIDGKPAGTPLPGPFEALWPTRNGGVAALRPDFTVELWGAHPALENKSTFAPFANLPGFGAPEQQLFAPAADRLLMRTHGGVTAAWTLGDPGDAIQVPSGRQLIAIAPDASRYARTVFVEHRGREYRRYYDVMVRPIAPIDDPDVTEADDWREAEHAGLVEAAAFSPDGRYLITASQPSVVQLSDLRDAGRRVVVPLAGHTAQVRGIRVAGSGDRFVTYGDDRTARVWRFDSPGTADVLRGHAGPVLSAAWSPDGRLLVTGSEDGVARLWDLDPPAEPLVLRASGDTVLDAWFTADDRFIVARLRSPDEYLEAWRLGAPASPIRLTDDGSDVSATALHPRHAWIALASDAGDIVVRELGTDAPPRRIGAHPGVHVIAFDDGGTSLVSASKDGRLRIWNIESGGEPVERELPPDRDLEEMEQKLRANPADERLQSQAIEMALLKQSRGAYDQVAMLAGAARVLASDLTSVFSWPLHGNTTGIRLNPGDKAIEAAAFDPTGAYVATSHAWDYTVRLWHADGSGVARTLGAATDSIDALRFSPDGRHLLVASRDGTVRIWPIDRSGSPVVLRGHTSSVVDADFTRDSRRVVTASYDGTARVWNVDGSGEEVILGLGTYSARFDSSGTRIVTASGDTRVAVWSLDAARLQRAIAARTRMCLDQAFRMRFLNENAAVAAARTEQCSRRQP